MTPASSRGDDQPDHAGSHRDPEPRDTPDCATHLAGADAVLAVTLRFPPRAWLAARDCSQPVAFVSTYPHPDCHRTFSDPADTAGIALAVADWLDALPDAVAPGVCLAGLDTLVEDAGRADARRFLQVVSGRVRAAGGTVHYHRSADAMAAAPPGRYLLDAAHHGTIR